VQCGGQSGVEVATNPLIRCCAQLISGLLCCWRSNIKLWNL